jgi:predicted RNA-binding Zn-ribbon protein involved in translation (DUF1610 family)
MHSAKSPVAVRCGNTSCDFMMTISSNVGRFKCPRCSMEQVRIAGPRVRQRAGRSPPISDMALVVRQRAGRSPPISDMALVVRQRAGRSPPISDMALVVRQRAGRSPPISDMTLFPSRVPRVGWNLIFINHIDLLVGRPSVSS